jgi:hypothetical protein
MELADTDDASPQAWNVVHPSECVVCVILASEDNASPSFNLGDGAIIELHCAGVLGVKLSEDFL